MIKFRSVNKLSQLYVVSVVAKNDSAFSAAEKRMLMSYRVAEMDSKARAVLEWLKSEDRAAVTLRGLGKDISRLDIPARMATKKHYMACEQVLIYASLYCSHSFARFLPGLKPELTNNF